MDEREQDGESEGRGKLIALHPRQQAGRVYKTTLADNTRRYHTEQCPHKGPYIVDDALGAMECQDCGAYLNPIFVLRKLAAQEAYWNKRQEDLTAYLQTVQQELEGRMRTRCTHCGEMTAIKFKQEMPRTWVPTPYG